MTRAVAVFDLDRTITRAGTFTPFLLSTRSRPLAKAALMAGILPRMLQYKCGLMERRDLKNRMMALAFAGMRQDQVTTHADAYARLLSSGGYCPGALTAIAGHRAQGHLTVLATAAMDFYAQSIARELEFDAMVATRTRWQSMPDGSAIPQIEGDNCYGAEKLARLQALLREHPDVDPATCGFYFYSDHHTDIPVFEVASNPVAANPSRRLRRFATANGLPTLNWR